MRLRVLIKQLADVLGVSVRQVQNLEREGMPRRRKGRVYEYDVAACVQWKAKRDAGMRRQPGAGADGQSPKQRKLAAEARLVELELEKVQGHLIEKEVAVDEIEKILELLRARLLNGPSKWAPRMVGLRSIPEALAVLEPLFTELMAELARTAEEIEAEADREADPPRRPSRAAS